jgi:hypothetical protein
MEHAALPLSLKASLLFEQVNRQEPVYKGEMLLLDPYSKLTAIWGSLAFSYYNANKKDSALWALKQGKKRGGFMEPVLEYNRQMLASCSNKSILITTGDNITFSLLYLQEIEKLRNDITIVDANLLNEKWYPKYLKREKSLNLEYSDQILDTLDYTSWQDSVVRIVNEKDTSQSLSWTLKPTYYDGYLLKGDRIMLDLFKQNLFKRDIYFSAPTDSTINLFLTSYLIPDGIVERMVSTTSTMEAFDSASKNLQFYSISKLSYEDVNKSSDAIKMWNGCRVVYLVEVVKLYNKGDFNNAKWLFKEMENRLPLAKLPLVDEAKDYYEQIKAQVVGVESSSKAGK